MLSLRIRNAHAALHSLPQAPYRGSRTVAEAKVSNLERGFN